MKFKCKFATYIYFVLLLTLVSACASGVDDSLSESDLIFTGYLEDTQNLKTRFDSKYIDGGGEYSQNYYIELFCTPPDGEPVPKYGIYDIPSGYNGRLSSVESNKALNWHDLTSNHLFYGWTIPWDGQYYKDNDVNTDAIEIKFENSDEIDYDIYGNNKIYETFIGCKSGPYSYNTHGKYVELTFFHLVSKIKIGRFQLTEASGAIQRNLKAEVTFINMPTTATFYPHPEGENEKKPYCRDGSPVVVPSESDPDNGITFFISNQPEIDKSDVFYICPETDFSKISYQVKLKNDEYKDYDTYYGTFDAVNFVRNNEGFDFEDGSDTKILHAGEMMTININLIPGVGPGLDITIQGWSTEKGHEAQYHTHAGIYSEAEMNELRSLFLQLTNDNKDEILERIKAIFDLYGKPEDEKNILELFDNLDLTTDPDGNIFPIWKDYILDGQGHTIIMRTNKGNPGNQWGGTYPYYNIGPCRNIYFTDPEGKNTIYIDDEGYVWITSKETGQLTKTQNKLEDLNTYQGGIYNSYDINAETGQIRYSTYFNNHITG